MMDQVFRPAKHIRSISRGRPVDMVGPDGGVLTGIAAVAGAAETMDVDVEIGVDRIIMQSGTEFALHTHPGAHILYVLKARGFVHVDGENYPIEEGDTIFVPANYPHSIRTDAAVLEQLELLAFGVPHKGVESTDRMTVVTPVDR